MDLINIKKKSYIFIALLSLNSPLFADDPSPELQTILKKQYAPMSDEFFEDFQKMRLEYCINSTKGAQDEQKRAALCPCISEYETAETKVNLPYLMQMQRPDLSPSEQKILQDIAIKYFTEGVTKCAKESGYFKK